MNLSKLRRLTDENKGVLKLCFVFAIAVWLLATFLFLPEKLVNQYGHMGSLNRIDYTKAVDDYRKTLAQIVGGAALLGGLYISWRNTKSTEDGRITDRFSKAVEQLASCNKDGKKQQETRLGGIYALERIAIDSERDRETIVNILCAYVRMNAPRKCKIDDPESEFDGVEPLHVVPVDVDIQATLTVLSTLNKRQRVFAAQFHFDLKNTELTGASLSDADLRNADLRGVILESAKLYRANLDYANLSGVDLRKVIGLTAKQLSNATIDGNTSLPNNMREE